MSALSAQQQQNLEPLLPPQSTATSQLSNSSNNTANTNGAQHTSTKLQNGNLDTSNGLTSNNNNNNNSSNNHNHNNSTSFQPVSKTALPDAVGASAVASPPSPTPSDEHKTMANGQANNNNVVALVNNNNIRNLLSSSPSQSNIQMVSNAVATGNNKITDANLSGYLQKWTNYIKGYQKRWFSLTNGLLSYYRSPNEMEHTCRGTINLANASISSEDLCHFVVSNGAAQTFHLKAATEVEKQKWINALELGIYFFMI